MPRRASPASASSLPTLSAILVTHEHTDHVGGVPAFAARHEIPVWVTFGTLTVVADRFEGMTQVYGFDSHDAIRGRRRSRSFRSPVPHDAREPVQFVDRRRRAPAGRADRPRRLDSARRGEPDAGATRWCSSAITTSTCWRTATIRGRSSSASRSRFGHLDNDGAAALLAALDTVAAACTSSLRTCRAEQHAASSRAQRSPARSAARRTGSASPTRTTASTGADLLDEGCAMEKRQELYKGKAKTVYATDDPHRLVMHYRDDVSAFDGVKLAQARAQGRDQQQDQRLRDGQARRGGRADAFRPPAERARVAGQGDEDAAGRVRGAQRLRGLDGQALRNRRGNEARRADLRILPEERRAARPARATTTTSACSAGRAPTRSRR